ncbi:MAG: glycosyltransferase family 2 protein [Rickettsiales bacterium]
MDFPLLSVVIPMHNEEENAAGLIAALDAALKDIDYEAVIVDDGSRDSTVLRLMEAATPRVRIVELARNYGQTAATKAGIDAAHGEYIALMDGDLQNDPTDIPEMLRSVEGGEADVVIGSRARRKDNFFRRKLPSRIANFLIRALTGLKISDQGCSLKLFKAEALKRLELHGDMHRFIAVLAHLDGNRIKEVPVRHHPRLHGKTKYGLGRTTRVVSDILLIVFFMRFMRRPMHLFGTIGVGLTLVGGLVESYLLALKISGESVGGRPLFFVGILFLVAGVQFITTGFVAEMLLRTYYAPGGGRTSYALKNDNNVRRR